MSIKNLFNNTKNINTLSAITKEDLSENIESEDFIDVYLENKEKFVPDIDFSVPSNFAKFGLAEEYYVKAIESIYNFYPYDGSQKEKIQWELSASHLEKFLFENEYPRTTGYARFGSGSYSPVTSSNGYSSGSSEYILTKGGPNLGPDSTREGANIYNTSTQRECNLKIDGTTGNTLEFWLKKESFNASQTETEVIFDNWTTSSISSSTEYGRFRLEMSASTGSPFYLTYMSGTSGFEKTQLSCSLTTASIADNNWHHYCFRIKNSGSNIVSDLFFDGNYLSTLTVSGNVGSVSGTLVSTIGALNTAPSGTFAPQRGWGKLSGSIDELRFWKTWRTSKEIERNWNTQVYGGTNTDTANTELGVYYKFNEGIIGTSSIDSVVLDYSGRISNGTWTGYIPTFSRNTGSAFNEYTGSTLVEFRDPIIYSTHSDVVDLIDTKRNLGREWDSRNAGSLYRSMPAWIIEEQESSATNQDENSLVALTQIMGSYFDTIAAQIDTIPKIKQNGYMSSSAKPYPFYDRLLESEGFKVPELFGNASVYEFFNNRTDEKIFEEKLYDVKNLIYQNLYNNLLAIYKSKGTEKGLRNVLRCFGIDNEIYKLNIYSKDKTFELKDNFVSDTIKKKFVNFNTIENSDATVYQWQDSGNSQSKSFISGSQNFTSGSEGQGIAFSYETEIIFPKHYDVGEFNTYLSGATSYSKNYPLIVTSSLFGMHTAKTTENDLEWNTNNYANFQVYCVKDDQYSNRGYFLLTSSAGGFFPTITSSYIENLYDDSRWNFVVSIYPSSYSQASLISGSYNDYTLELRGVKKTLDNTDDSFVVSGSISNANGQKILASNKRIYLGAHKTNFTGSTLTFSDVKVSTAKVYYSKLESNELESHAQDSRIFGKQNPHESTFTYQESMTGKFVPKVDSLILHWDFDQVTGSNSSGQFAVSDLTSGSSEIRSRYGSWYGNVLGYQYTGRGDFFQTSSVNAIRNEDVFIAKKQLPEFVYSSDLVNILSQDDTQFDISKQPTSYFMLVEKSMYQNISEEMLKYLNTVIDFNTLIGEPVSRYRDSYKNLERLRTHFFERVGNIPDIEKYIEYYKWLDTAVTVAISQTTPATSNLSSEYVRNVIESHIFERNKYRYNFPLFSGKRNENITTTTKGIGELSYNWKYGHASNNSYENSLWQRDRKEASTTDLQKIKDVITSKNDNQIPIFSGTSGPYSGSVYEFRALNESRKISVSSNYNREFNSSFYKPLVMAGSGSYGISLDLSNTGSEITTDYSDLSIKKKVPNIKATILQDSTKEYKAESVIPFTIMSSSTNGYEITNLHNDVYAGFKDAPLQSPYTEKHVGGNQVRHISREFNSEFSGTRPEAFHLSVSGTTVFVRSPKSVNSLGQQYSYFRDEVAKRPVSIKNIPILTASNGATSIGNFSKTYEILSISGRTANNRYVVKNEGITITSSYSPAISGVIDYNLVDRTISGNYGNPVIVTRFSPLGSPETDSEGYLDCVAGEYSIYSTVNWRNLGIRNYADLWSQRPCGQFGYDSEAVGITLPATMSGTYENSASFHKTNRNRQRRIAESSSTYITASKYDNEFVQNIIPRSDKQYTWINDSITNDIFGYEQPNYSLASLASTDIQHFSQSLYSSSYKFVDLAGMSMYVQETYNPLTMTAQYETGSSPLGNFNNHYTNALVSHQNGLNSWPTWKQIRGTAMSRYVASKNILYFVNEKNEKTIVIEPSISTRHKSLDFNINVELDNQNQKQIMYSIPFGSNISKVSDHSYFSAYETQTDFSKFFKENPQTKEYTFIKGLIRSETIDEKINPIKSLNYIKYKEQIYPKEQFVTIYRGRDAFTSSFWKSSRSERLKTSGTNYLNVSVNSGSIWVLDSRTSYDTGSSFTTASQIGSQGEGELQNNHTTFHLGSKNSLKLDVLYSRRTEEFIGSSSIIYAGDTKWEAASQSLVEPAYNSYSDYVEDLKKIGKDYNVIPEFRISEHMDYYVNEKYGNFLQENTGIFTITGSTISSSNDPDFYKKYSTTDFLKYFDVVKGDFDDVLKTGELSLKCNVVKRFIPYDGFYPAQRTVQLAKLFLDSYSGSITVSGSDSSVSASYRPIFQPLFAPGILFNTIKSGIAVDYPVYTAAYTVTGSISSSDDGIPRLKSNFDYRVPFEAILEPEVYLKGKKIVDQEPHPSASLNVTASIVGVGSKAYKLAMNNFTAETISMFLKNGELTTFSSAPENDPQYFNVKSGKKYFARIVCTNARYHSQYQISQLASDVGTSIYLSQSYEYNPPTIKMYENVGSGSGKNNKSAMWGASFGPPVEMNESIAGNVSNLSSASYKPFTPPYYGGYSDIELEYQATGSGRVRISDILSNLTASCNRLDNLSAFSLGVDEANKMHLSSSVNYMQVSSEKTVKYDSSGNAIEVDDANKSSRWVIQPKFETPILDFTSSQVTLPISGSSSVNVGMWHQYGSIPNDSNKGLFLEIQDLNSEEISSSTTTGSLAELVGFRRGSQKIGQIKDEQIISEAIVAVPFFVNSKGFEERFAISRSVINNAELFLNGQKTQYELNISENPKNKPSEQIIKMVENMKKFVIPPRLNFLDYKQIEPFAMYIFKFDTKFVQPDLAKIWQNLPPSCSEKIEQDELTISHNLSIPDSNGTELIEKFESKIQWLVFKAKQKASWNYFEKTADSKDDSRFKFKFNDGTEESKLGVEPKYSYNWPYDFCSIIELGKIEAGVKLIPKEKE